MASASGKTAAVVGRGRVKSHTAGVSALVCADVSKAFVKESDSDFDGEPVTAGLPQGVRNYITPAGYGRLKAELRQLVEQERPEVVKTVSWAASNGDRSENGDYIYGKRRLREIDRRVRFLIKRLETAEVVDAAGRDTDQVFFGATVAVRVRSGEGRTITIVGIDEVDPGRGRVSWISPVAKALLKAREGDVVLLRSPAGLEEIEILSVRYDPID
jgi:transcription elongation factor GreB